MREPIASDEAPRALGAYSQALRAGGLLFCSGQIGIDPQNGELAGPTAAEQAERCLLNLEAVCRAAGTELERASRITVYLADIEDFAAVDEVYARHFERDPPARVTVGVAALPKAAKVEIDAVVAIDEM